MGKSLIGGLFLLLGGVLVLAAAAMGYAAIFTESPHWCEAALLTLGLSVAALFTGADSGWWDR